MTLVDSQPVDTPPAHGWTRHGHAVHGRTVDHLPARTAYQRFNKQVAVWVTSTVGTMTCAYLFALLGMVAMYGAFTENVALTLIAGSISGYFLQLVLLPALMVGQNLQSAAADSRAAKTFEDVEALRTEMRELTTLVQTFIVQHQQSSGSS